MTETTKTYTQIYKQQLSELDDENKRLTKEHQELLAQNRSLFAQNQELLTQNDGLQRENETLSNQNAALEDEKCRTEAELEKWSSPKARLSERIDAMTLILSSFRRNSGLIWFEEGEESPEAKREKEAFQQIADRLDEAADPSLVTRVVFFFVAFVADIYAFAVSHCLALLRRFYQQRADVCQKDLEEQYERRRQALEHEQEEARQALERKQKEAWQAMEQAVAEKDRELSDLRSASARLEAERKRLDALVQNKTQVIAELESRVQSLEAGLQEKDIVISKLNSQIGSLNKKLESANKTLAERDGQIKKLQGELSSARAANERLLIVVWLLIACVVLAVVFFVMV